MVRRKLLAGGAEAVGETADEESCCVFDIGRVVGEFDECVVSCCDSKTGFGMTSSYFKCLQAPAHLDTAESAVIHPQSAVKRGSHVKFFTAKIIS